MYFEFDEPKVGAKDPPITADDLISGYLSKKKSVFLSGRSVFSRIKEKRFFSLYRNFLENTRKIFSNPLFF